MPGLLQMLTIVAQPLGPLYQVTSGKHRIEQRFSNFFQVGTIFISQNVLRTTLLLNVLSLC